MVDVGAHLVWDGGSHRFLLGPLPVDVVNRITAFARFETRMDSGTPEVSWCVYPVVMKTSGLCYLNKDFFVVLTNFGRGKVRSYFVQSWP